MKQSKYLRFTYLLVFFVAFGLITACNNEQGTDESSDEPANEMSQNDNMPSQSADAGTVNHYKCPNGHAEGGANQPSNCSVCGAKLVHNDAYHQQQQLQQQGGQGGQGGQTQQQLQQKLQQQRQQMEPKVNDEGEKVFHYACPEGHNKGGSMQPGTCSVCGAKLVHNDPYHQN